MSGADMLRYALGLEGSPLAGGTLLAGEGWAAELLGSARSLPSELPTRPEGFKGTLRTYQADALVWLGFLEQAGLGGCLALDMGPGQDADDARPHQRNPLARPVTGGGAACGGRHWASEARRFVPGLRVVVHHGPNRTPAAQVASMAKKADLVVSTYGTVMRDLDALEKVEWSTVVLDEAQAIKNPASEDGPAAATSRGPQPGDAYRHPDRERSGRPVGDHGLLQSRPARRPQPVHC